VSEEKKPIDFAQWWRAFVSSWVPAGYRDLAESPAWFAFAAVAIIGVIQYSVMTARLAAEWPGIVNQVSAQWEKSLPKITIKGGVASTGETKPVTGEISVNEIKIKVLIDTSGASRSLDPAWTDALLVGSREIVIRQTPPEMKPMEERRKLSELTEKFGDIVINADGIRNLGKKIMPYWLGTMFAQGMLRFVLFKIIHIFFGSLVMLITAVVSRRRVQYPKLIKLAVYAIIPAITFEMFILLVSLVLPRLPYAFFFFPYIAIYMAYLVLSVLSLPIPVSAEAEK